MKLALSKKLIRRILILYWGRFGDVIVTLPLIEVLKGIYPQAKVTYLVSSPNFREVGESAGKILEHHPYVEKWMESDISLVRTIVASPPYDLAIDLVFKKNSGAIFSYLSGAEYKIWGKFRGLPRHFFWTRRLENGLWGKPKKVAVRSGLCRVGMFLEIARFLRGKKVQTRAPKIYLSSREKEIAKDFFKQMGCGKKMLVGIHPGTRSWPARSWHECSYAHLADALREEPGAEVVVFYGPGEKRRAARICRHAKYPIKMVFEKDLRKLFSKISACQLFITSDGGTLHMALALGVPSVGLFNLKRILRYWYASYCRSGRLLPISFKGHIFRRKEVSEVIHQAREILK